MNKPVFGVSVVLILAVVAAGIIFDISPLIWLPVLVVIVVFGGFGSRSAASRRVGAHDV